jgi:hypothetical protein
MRPGRLRGAIRAPVGSGVTPRSAQRWSGAAGTEQTAAGVHGMASGTYPFLKPIEPATFLKLLAGAEIGLGAALLLPVVPAVVAGAGLVGFAGGLLGLYLRTPGMREGVRPTQQGTPIAKDVWLLGIGAALVLDDLIARRRPAAT